MNRHGPVVTFYLGVHRGHWDLGVPTFVSARTLRRRVSDWPAHNGPEAIDSGGFTEISKHGKWRTSPEQYAAELMKWTDTRGAPEWAAPQDWMCEPDMLAKTGKTIEEHQALSVASVLRLRELASGVHVIPVLQGWDVDDYVDCVDLYESAGFDLRSEPVVGVGTVCRRQDTSEGNHIIRTLAGMGLRLHGFGYKTTGLLAVQEHMHSADSMAWSLNARKNAPLPECSHANCCNCWRYAMRWRSRLLQRLAWGRAQQPMFGSLQ
jgi:hypothetical protein